MTYNKYSVDMCINLIKELKNKTYSSVSISKSNSKPGLWRVYERTFAAVEVENEFLFHITTRELIEIISICNKEKLHVYLPFDVVTTKLRVRVPAEYHKLS
jgi:hypothetical protein